VKKPRPQTRHTIRLLAAALLQDNEYQRALYLALLRACHSGADLGTDDSVRDALPRLLSPECVVEMNEALVKAAENVDSFDGVLVTTVQSIMNYRKGKS
jgi:hypothetical protein